MSSHVKISSLFSFNFFAAQFTYVLSTHPPTDGVGLLGRRHRRLLRFKLFALVAAPAGRED